MAAKKVIAICQSGGEFVTNKDGSLSYTGGEAYAIDIDQQTLLDDFKSEIADMFNCSAETMSIKYFLPGNKKTLITISKDKDLQRMVNFLGDTATVDVFVMSEEAAARNVSNMPASRYFLFCSSYFLLIRYPLVCLFPWMHNLLWFGFGSQLQQSQCGTEAMEMCLYLHCYLAQSVTRACLFVFCCVII